MTTTKEQIELMNFCLQAILALQYMEAAIQ